MKSVKKDNLLYAVLYAALGILFMIMKGGVISVALTIIGAGVILMAVSDFSNGLTATGILKAVLGVCIIVFGWMFVSLALYILSAVLIVQGIFGLISAKKYASPGDGKAHTAFAYMKPAANLIAGIFLLINQSRAVDWVFIAVGALLLVEGILNLADCRD